MANVSISSRYALSQRPASPSRVRRPPSSCPALHDIASASDDDEDEEENDEETLQLWVQQARQPQQPQRYRRQFAQELYTEQYAARAAQNVEVAVRSRQLQWQQYLAQQSRLAAVQAGAGGSRLLYAEQYAAWAAQDPEVAARYQEQQQQRQQYLAQQSRLAALQAHAGTSRLLDPALVVPQARAVNQQSPLLQGRPVQSIQQTRETRRHYLISPHTGAPTLEILTPDVVNHSSNGSLRNTISAQRPTDVQVSVIPAPTTNLYRAATTLDRSFARSSRPLSPKRLPVRESLPFQPNMPSLDFLSGDLVLAPSTGPCEELPPVQPPLPDYSCFKPSGPSLDLLSDGLVPPLSPPLDDCKIDEFSGDSGDGPSNRNEGNGYGNKGGDEDGGQEGEEGVVGGGGTTGDRDNSGQTDSGDADDGNAGDGGNDHAGEGRHDDDLDHALLTLLAIGALSSPNGLPSFQNSLEHDKFRLLSILPGQHCDPLQCILDEFGSHANVPTYYALSYAWGDTSHKRFVEIRGFDVKIAVTKNCCDALRSLRHTASTVRLWINAICINQQDAVEKARQVGIMGHIYRRAAAIIAYVGEPDEDVGVLFDWNWPSRSREELENLKTRLDRFMKRPWFHRTWVIQETLLARAITLQCGTIRLPWDHFVETYKLVHSLPANIDSPQIFQCNLVEIRHWYRMQEQQAHRGIEYGFDGRDVRKRVGCLPYAGILDMLLATRNYGCGDGRDRLYALLSLFTQGPPARLEADYKKPVDKVFTDTARFLLLENISISNNRSLLQSLPIWLSNPRCEATLVQLQQIRCVRKLARGDISRLSGEEMQRISDVTCSMAGQFLLAWLLKKPASDVFRILQTVAEAEKRDERRTEAQDHHANQDQNGQLLRTILQEGRSLERTGKSAKR